MFIASFQSFVVTYSQVKVLQPVAELAVFDMILCGKAEIATGGSTGQMFTWLELASEDIKLSTLYNVNI